MRSQRLRVSAITAATLASLSGSALAARVDYTVDLGVEENDNVTLVPFDPIEQRYLRAGLGFTVTENTSALQTSLDGRVEYRDYEDDVFSDTVDGTLSGRLNWRILPDRLFFTAEDNLSVQPVDALAPDAPGNRQQVNVFSMGPTLLVNWSPSFQGQAELRYINSDAETTEEFNSQRIALALRTVKELSPVSRLTFNAQGQHVDFDDDVFARDYNRYDLFGRYVRTLARFELGADLGYSRLDYRQGESRSEPLIRLDAAWNLSPSSTLTARVASEFSDTAIDALTGIEADATMPENVLTGDAVVNASPYEVRSYHLEYAYASTRLNFTIAPFVQTRDYVDSDEFDQDGRGVRGDVHWRMRQNLVLSGHAAQEKLEYTNLDREDKTTRFGATLRYHWSQHLSVALQWERYRRDTTEPNQDVSQNIVYLSVSYTNR